MDLGLEKDDGQYVKWEKLLKWVLVRILNWELYEILRKEKHQKEWLKDIEKKGN